MNELIVNIFTPELPLAVSVFLASTLAEPVGRIASEISFISYLFALLGVIYGAIELWKGSIGAALLALLASALIGGAGLIASALFSAGSGSSPINF